jgi:hypothetical protein
VGRTQVDSRIPGRRCSWADVLLRRPENDKGQLNGWPCVYVLDLSAADAYSSCRGRVNPYAFARLRAEYGTDSSFCVNCAK